MEPTSRLPTKIATEINLVAQAKKGDRRAFGELVHQHREGVLTVLYRLCGDITLAEDIAQETFIKAWQKLDRYQPISPFRNWLYRIATNTALDYFRRQKPLVSIDDLPLASKNKGPESIAEQQEQSAIVQQAVLDLPTASRAVLILREFEGLSYRDIAFTLNIPIGTVMSRLNYARNQLRLNLTTYLEVI